MHKIAVVMILSSVASLLSSSAPDSSKRTGSFHIYKSDDHGVSWSAVGSGVPTSKRINALAIERSVSFAGTDDGIFISADDGRTWSGTIMMPVQSFAVAGGRVYAGTKNAGVLVTQDRGRSWLPVARGLADLNVRSLATQGSDVYAGTNSKGVFVLRDGKSWTSFGEGLPEHSQVFDLAITGRQVYAALYNKGLFRIETGGGRWKRVGDVTPLEFLVRGRSLLAGHNPGGIYRSIDDGATWKPAAGLLGRAPIWVMGDAGPNMLAGTSPGAIVLSNDLGASWRPSAAGLPPGASVVAIGDGPDYTLAAIVLPGDT